MKFKMNLLCLNVDFYQLLNFDYRFLNMIFIFKFYSTDFGIPDLNPMKTTLKFTV